MAEDKDVHARKNRRGWLQLGLVILFLGGAVFLSRYLASLQMAPQPKKSGVLRPLVETAEVAPQAYRLRFTATGTVQVRAMTDIVPQISGRIVAIDENAFAGGPFTAETVLFTIDKSDYRLRFEQMEAEVARAKTELELQQARSETAAAEWLDLNPGAKVPPLVGEEPQLEAARAAVEAAKSQLEMARLDLDRTEFRLPFTGRITELQLEIGQHVVAGQSYGKAYRLDSIEIDMPLTERQLDWLLESSDPVITVSSDYLSGAVVPAFVKRVGAKLDPETRLTRAVLGLKEPGADVVPDVFVEIEVIGPARENVWVLPLDALQQNGGIWTVTRAGILRLLRPPIIQITEEAVIAESDGSTLLAVRGNLAEATEGTPVRLAGKQASGEQRDGR